jgi:predicted patatin/cPLA2 family phospholipase
LTQISTKIRLLTQFNNVVKYVQWGSNEYNQVLQLINHPLNAIKLREEDFEKIMILMHQLPL